jgi:two-component system, LytTR family, sensor kinase
MKKSVVILIHVIFWSLAAGLALTNLFAIKYLRPDDLSSANHFPALIPYLFILSPIYFYIGYFGIIKMIKNKGLALFVTVAVILTYLILLVVTKNMFRFGLTLIFPSLFFWVLIGSLLRVFIDWSQSRNIILTLEKQNAESNLALLRTQINPHFLFNTLHNIDTLIMDNQEKASKALIKLSDIMRYMLHESPLEKVSLKKEMEHIKNYISLEQLRIKNPDFLKFVINGECNEIKIAPMLFLPFIENAFKHSVDSDCENGITIKFRINRNNITFICVNIYDKSDSNRDSTRGIGLETVKQRLELIYPDKHKLVINKNEDSFNVELNIVVNEN